LFDVGSGGIVRCFFLHFYPLPVQKLRPGSIRCCWVLAVKAFSGFFGSGQIAVSH
jgi:hypothetical protein